jgi:voltage-gated potassium channel
MRWRKRRVTGPLVRAAFRRRRRLTWLQALVLVAATNVLIVLIAAALVTRTDPDRYPDLGTALWWAATTITTVGYGDVVPASGAGRLVAAVLMFAGIGSFAFLTAIAASAIVVGEVGEEEREIEREERRIHRAQQVILGRLGEIDARLERIEQARTEATEGGVDSRTPSTGRSALLPGARHDRA